MLLFSVAQLCPTLCHPAARQASLSFTISWSLLKLTSIESVMPSNYFILSSSSPLAFNLPQHQGLFQWVCSLHQVPNYWRFNFTISFHNGYSGLIALRLTGLISLQSKRLSGVFSSTTFQKHQFFTALPSLWSSSHISTWLLGKP